MLKLPVFPLLAVRIPINRSLLKGATETTTVPPQSRPVDVYVPPETVQVPVTLQYRGFDASPVMVESAFRVVVTLEYP